MPRIQGMGMLSPRQGEILGLMGIDVWRWRADPPPEPIILSPDHPSSSPTAIQQIDGSELGSNWCLVQNATDANHDTWIFCQENAELLISDGPYRRLLDDVLRSMRLNFRDVALFCAVQQAVDESLSAMYILQDPSCPVPKRLVVFGDECGAWVREHIQADILSKQLVHKTDDDGMDILFSDDLLTLMDDPKKKRALWHRMINSGWCRDGK